MNYGCWTIYFRLCDVYSCSTYAFCVNATNAAPTLVTNPLNQTVTFLKSINYTFPAYLDRENMNDSIYIGYIYNTTSMPSFLTIVGNILMIKPTGPSDIGTF